MRRWWRDFVVGLVGWSYTCHACGHRITALSERGYRRKVDRHLRSCRPALELVATALSDYRKSRAVADIPEGEQ